MEKYKSIKIKFEENSNAENSLEMEKYMRNQFKFYGIKTKERRSLYKDLIKDDKKRGKIDWDFLYLCFDDDYREINYLSLDYLKAMEKLLSFEDVEKLMPFVKTKQWWDSIDVIDTIIGNIGLKDTRIDELMLRWSTDEDFWVRRIAINHQRKRKEKTNAELLEKIIINNFGSDEFFINKAIGWSLREYSKVNPEWVKKFFDKYSDKMNSLSIREGSKYI